MINVIKHCRIKYKLKYLWFFVFVYVFLLIKFFVCFFPTCFCILGNFFFCVKNITHEVNIYVRYHNLFNFMRLFIRQEYSSVCVQCKTPAYFWHQYYYFHISWHVFTPFLIWHVLNMHVNILHNLYIDTTFSRVIPSPSNLIDLALKFFSQLSVVSFKYHGYKGNWFLSHYI